MGILFFADSDADDDDEQQHRLHDIRAEEVSLVDRAANQRRFILLKGRDAMSKPQGAELDVDQDGNLVVQKDDDTDKAGVSIPSAVKEAITQSATEALKRLQSVVETVKSATAIEEASETPLPATLGSELKAIGGLLADIGKQYPSPTATDDVEKTDDSATGQILAAIADLKSAFTAVAEKAQKPDDATPGDEDEKKRQVDKHAPAPFDIAPLAKAFDNLADAVRAQGEQIAEIRKRHPGSNAVGVGDGAGKGKEFVWPMEMSADDADAQ